MKQKEPYSHRLKILIAPAVSYAFTLSLFFLSLLLATQAFLPVSPSFSYFYVLISFLATAIIIGSPSILFRSFDFLHHIPVSGPSSAVSRHLFPLDYVVRAPAVDYQSVDSQRAAKASSTNMRQYPNDWLLGSGPWKQAAISG